jgi:N-acetyl-D-muramate 6-phosphate phosphatase
MPLDLPRIHALCFDIDGTLSDTDDLVVDHIVKRLMLVKKLFRNGDPYPFARLLVMGAESPGNFIYGMLDSLGIDHKMEGLKREIADYLARHGWSSRSTSFWLIPQTRSTLEFLATKYPMAVVSARDPSGTHAFLNQFSLYPFFQAIAHSQTCRHTKPFPDPIYWAAAEMGVASKNCLMIGDTTVDIRSGKAAGAQTVGVLCGFGRARELERAGADLILPSPIDLISLLNDE